MTTRTARAARLPTLVNVDFTEDGHAEIVVTSRYPGTSPRLVRARAFELAAQVERAMWGKDDMDVEVDVITTGLPDGVCVVRLKDCGSRVDVDTWTCSFVMGLADRDTSEAPLA